MKEKTKNNNTSELITLIITVLAVFAALALVVFVVNPLIGKLPQPFRAISGVLVQWVPAIPVLIIALAKGYRPSFFGFTAKKLPVQLLIGLGIGVAMSVVLTLVPILVGLRNFVSPGYKYTLFWQFAYEFAHTILGVALAEELIFRGFIYGSLMKIKNSAASAILFSSLLFGLFHIFGGNIIQVVLTGLLGAFWCFCRLKIKNCTTLSLIIAHGVYDALIVLLASVIPE